MKSPLALADRPTPLKRRKLYEDVVQNIERAIQVGEYTPGDRLPSERQLMAHFGVGRPSIRHALFALRKMGLMEVKNGDRARVIRPTPSVLIGELSGVVRHLLRAPEGMRHFQQARAIFETALAEYAARHATADDLKLLREALRANERAVNDPEQFVNTDVGFHFAIAQIPKNPVLTALHTGISEWLAEQRWTGIQIEGSMRVAVAAHARILAAIDKRDPVAAAEMMREHLSQVEKYYWSARENVSERPTKSAKKRQREKTNDDE